MNGLLAAAAEVLAVEHVAAHCDGDAPGVYIAEVERVYLDALTVAAQSVEPPALCEFLDGAGPVEESWGRGACTPAPVDHREVAP